MTQGELIRSIERYFAAERGEAKVGILLVAGFVAIALFGLSLDAPYGAGLAIPNALLSPVLAFVVGFVYLRAPKDVARATRSVIADPAGLAKDEIPRMRKVVRNFRVYRAIEIGMLVLGAILLVASASPFLHGIGAGLVELGAVFLVFDGIADRRAKRYLAALEAFTLPG